MRKDIFLLAVVSLIGIALFTQKVEAQTVDLNNAARAFVGELAREDFSAAVERFGSPLNDSLPPEELRKTWTGIIAKGGSFTKIVGVEDRVEEYGGQKYDVVIVHCQLERAETDVRMSFNRRAQITSLWFVPPQKNR